MSSRQREKSQRSWSRPRIPSLASAGSAGSFSDLLLRPVRSEGNGSTVFFTRCPVGSEPHIPSRPPRALSLKTLSECRLTLKVVDPDSLPKSGLAVRVGPGSSLQLVPPTFAMQVAVGMPFTSAGGWSRNPLIYLWLRIREHLRLQHGAAGQEKSLPLLAAFLRAA